ncbi:PilZ domain-containing protein [Bowmanella pacifica]|uniref:PilZ domain-containing protein n=2 Tax=Bowmanella TaxID=366580 RepID=A0A917Z584_9ALTE|nr:PilZ domain-containing protein [Bowmanella pacifica]GGO74735.1 hypothetical protein GCM10010982_38270 [Bowmanella pacifica]
MQNVIIQACSEQDKEWLSHVHNGTRIDIQLLDQYDSRFQSELIGYRFGRYLIIRFDEFVIPQSMNCTGLIAVCRFLIEDSLGECFAFKSEIVNTLRRPDKLLFMAFPREIHRRPLRATKRQSLKIPASISLRSTQGVSPSFDGALIDLSAKGCRFQFDASHTGRKVNLLPILIRIDWPERGIQKEVSGMVRNSKMQDGFLTIGVQFDEVQPDLDISL